MEIRIGEIEGLVRPGEERGGGMSGMEFYSERISTARKQHRCEMCGKAIEIGETYGRESGKFYGDFFTRALHIHCQNMEHEYCNEVDSEFTWDAITDYIQDIFCYDCEHSARRDDEPEWTDCPYMTVCECPKVIENYSGIEKEATHA
jgi:hypothetical protein